ncbi:MAG: hypothetical protein Q8J63_01220 [Candidatus Aquicultor sp.]|nr:hypothetical protein [Candidatus Aquicultor sp.]
MASATKQSSATKSSTKRARATATATVAPAYQSVIINIDPKKRNLDKTVRDVLLISDLIAERIPSARMESISVNDYFAVAEVDIARGRTHETVTLRLYEINGVWKIRGTAFGHET